MTADHVASDPLRPAALPTEAILAYLGAAHRANAEAEVSGAELRYELGLDAETVRESVAELVRRGLVEWDPLLSNIWLRLTELGQIESGAVR